MKALSADAIRELAKDIEAFVRWLGALAAELT
jgi:hypothetical protein